MIPRTETPVQPIQPLSWQQELAAAITDPRELLVELQLDPQLLPAAQAAARVFGLKVPGAYVARMAVGDVDDPLLRQVLPLGEELNTVDGYSADPVGDLNAMTIPGLLHKYHGRALLITSPTCAIHCRYCFRRDFPYAEARANDHEWEESISYLAAHPDISEVILSGGDPLTLGDRRLAELFARLESVGHLKRVRIHTRLPVVLPSRVTRSLLALVSSTRLQVVLVIHANHANELAGPVLAVMRQFRETGITLLNQAVLLRGVNDTVDALCNLSESLFECGVLPYYLHQLDRVRGSAHFEVPEGDAKALYRGIQTRLPGYLVPRFVREEAGRPYKLPVG